MQRSRLLIAAASVISELGAGKATVADVVAKAGVSRRTFYEIFDGYEQCMLATIEHAISLAEDRIRTATDGHHRWLPRVRSGLIAGLAFLDEQPQLARILIVESLAAGPDALQYRSKMIGRLAAAIEDGARPGGAQACPLIGEAALGSVLAILHGRMIDPKRKTGFVQLSGELASIIVLAFQGQAAACRERTRKLQLPEPVKPAGSPLGQVDVRFTYRTMRVILAVGEQPGASNRLIAAAAEIRDPGQISKLLARLQSQGVVEKTGGGRGTGSANRWQLTMHGQELLSAIRAGEA